MRLHNFKDAGSMLPPWLTALLLNGLFIGLYAVALYALDAKPNSYVGNACTLAILLSLIVSLGILVREILLARAGEVAVSVNKGLVAGLNLSWAISALAFACYIGWNPVTSLIQSNVSMTISGVIAAILVFGGFYFSAPYKKSAATTEGASQSLALAPGFKETLAQTPSFQVTIADLTRLLSHQAGRAIGYAGSNILIDDSFSLELDANERIARVYSNSNLVNSEDFMYWRLHMLMMGSAAEKVLTGKSSQVALDDLTSFDQLASDYLTLRPDRTFNAAPVTLQEAQIKASRIAMLRKNVYDRCHAACTENSKVLTDLVRMMRTRSVLTYGDIRVYLDRVQMPEGFPVASFDNDEILQKALLNYIPDEEVTLEGACVHPLPTAAEAVQSSQSSDFQEDAAVESAPVYGAKAANEDPTKPACMTA